MRQPRPFRAVPTMWILGAVVLGSFMVAACAGGRVPRSATASGEVRSGGVSEPVTFRVTDIRFHPRAPALMRRYGAAAVAVDGVIYVAGGLGEPGSARQVIAWKPVADGPAGDPTVVARLPLPTHDLALAFTGGSLDVLGGGAVRSYDTIERVDPSSGRVTAAGRLPTPLSDTAAASAGHTVYLVGGYTGSRSVDRVTAVRVGGGSRTVARLPSGLRYAAVSMLHGSLVVAGGLTPAGYSGDLLSIDVKTGELKRVTTFPAPFAYASAVSVGGRVLILGGRTDQGPSTTIWSWDGHRLDMMGRLPAPVSDASAVAIGSRVYVLGGRESVDDKSRPTMITLDVSGGMAVPVSEGR